MPASSASNARIAAGEPVNPKWVLQAELDIWRVQARPGERYKVLVEPSSSDTDWWTRFLRTADTSSAADRLKSDR